MLTQYGNMIAGGQRMMDGPALGAGGFGGFGLFGILGFIVLAALVIGIVVWAVAHKRPAADVTVAAATTPVTPAPAGDAALAIARERLARGEIDPDQFVAIVAALGGQTIAPTPQG